MRKALSILTILAITIALLGTPDIITSAADVIQNEERPTNSIELQQVVLQLDQALANSEGLNATLNDQNVIEIYTDDVARINEDATKTGRSLVYGAWFGGADSYYSMSPSESILYLGCLTIALTPFLGVESLAATVASAITAAVGNFVVSPGQTLVVDRTKRYREVKYSDGSFAYWQTKVGASATRANTYMGYGETIISGGMW